MAISAVHYRLLKEHQSILPKGGRLLEIGEANWYGDSTPEFPCSGFRAVTEPAQCNANAGACRHPAVAYKNRDSYDTDVFCERHYTEVVSPFDVAKACYAALFAPREIVSVDWHGTAAALKLDLNGHVVLPGKFDLCINHGTAEHIFNIAQVFRTMHDACAAGGLMIHESPFTGWIDHGFYNLNPTLFYDLAAANGYEVVSVSVTVIDPPTIVRLECREHAASLAVAGTLPNNAMLFVVYRKRGTLPFKIPVQGYYAQSLSAAGEKAWRELR